VQKDGQREERAEPDARREEMHGIHRDSHSWDALRGGAVAGGPDEREAPAREADRLQTQRPPVPAVALLVGEEEERPQEQEQAVPHEPHRSVLRARQDRAEGGRRDAAAEAEAGRDTGLAPQVEQAGGEREGEGPPPERDEPRIERRQAVPARLRRPRRGAQHQDEEGEDSDEQARAQEVDASDRGGEHLHRAVPAVLLLRLQRERVAAGT
jgi:hypothetical protein